MHEIDYEIFGNEMQYVEVELDPMEAAVAEAGGTPGESPRPSAGRAATGTYVVPLPLEGR